STSAGTGSCRHGLVTLPARPCARLSSPRHVQSITGQPMKLAEALMERAELRRRMQDLRERILRNAKYQEGDTPAEDPRELLAEYDDASATFKSLVTRINNTNNTVALEDGRLMVEALADRDALKEKHSLYKSLVAEATP